MDVIEKGLLIGFLIGYAYTKPNGLNRLCHIESISVIDFKSFNWDLCTHLIYRDAKIDDSGGLVNDSKNTCRYAFYVSQFSFVL